jgi:hypothetical protein
VPFHVEIRSGYQHARAFNLGTDELREQILLRWLGDQRIELGDQTWDPRDATLTVLEGPALEGRDLAFGQGWQNAGKRSGNVTAAALEAVRGTVEAPRRAPAPAASTPPTAAPAPAPLAILAADSPAAGSARDLLAAELGLRPVEWQSVRTRLLARAAVVAPAPAEATAVLAILDGLPDERLALELGLALGALGGRVVVAAAGGAAELAAALPGVPVIDGSATEAIAERLRLAGAAA